MKPAYHCCLAISFFICYNLHSQFYFSSGNNPEPELLWELGVSVGATNCLTDIGGNGGAGTKFLKDINWNKTQVCGSLFASATWQSSVALRLEATTGQITGSDDVLKNSTDISRARYLRNLQFKTSITELALLTELHPITLFNRNRDPSAFSPYLLGGIGVFNYNPQANINNVWVELRPLHTEGEGFKQYPGRNEYGSFSWCIPVGAGLKYDVAGLITFRFELLYRFTGTDYLDDVSTKYIDPSLFNKYLSPAQAALAIKLNDRSAALPGVSKNNTNDIRGNPKNKDAYFSCTIKAAIAFGRAKRK